MGFGAVNPPPSHRNRFEVGLQSREKDCGERCGEGSEVDRQKAPGGGRAGEEAPEGRGPAGDEGGCGVQVHAPSDGGL